MSEAHKAVFLSYASQDAEAAKRICDALRAAGVEVWFDQSELRGGDSWDQKIRRQIKECALFVPLISANTQARPEGYFRLEWKLAVDRSHLMADDAPFLFPVVIDDTPDSRARVPDKFRDVQWTRLNVKDTPETLAVRVGRLLHEPEPEERGPGAASRTPRAIARPQPVWPRYALAGVGLLFAAIYAGWKFWKPTEPKPAGSPPAAASAAFSEAQQLVTKARAILDQGDELNREKYALAEEILRKAEALDPTDAAAWSLHAQMSADLSFYGFDASPARATAMRTQADRAHSLAPDSLDAKLASIRVREEALQDLSAVSADAASLAAAYPNDWRVLRALGRALEYEGKGEEAVAAVKEARRQSGFNPSPACDLVNDLTAMGRFAAAEQVIAEQPAGMTSVRLLAHDVFITLYWRGDAAAAMAKVARWPEWFLAEDRGAGHAALAAWWRRDGAAALRIAAGFSRDYLHDYLFTGPRAVLSALAHEQAGHGEAAQADWRGALRAAEHELAEVPDSETALHWKAWALARLGDRAAAGEILRLLVQRGLERNDLFIFGGLAGLRAQLGDVDGAVDELARVQGDLRSNLKPLTRAFLVTNPAFDPLRANPRFQALVAAAAAPEAPASAPPTPSAVVKPDDKSVAVLAFANLSDDKANEYFSDGISEELLNVLAKVPGLKVAARTSAFYFKGKEVPVPEIAKQLGVAYVVEGSVRKSGDRVRITAQLIKAADGFHVWSDTFTRELKDIFAVQDEIAQLVAKNLELKMGVASFQSRREVNPEAHQRVLEGWHDLALRTWAGFDQAEEAFNAALRLDPQFAVAHAGLANVSALRGRYRLLSGLGQSNEFAAETLAEGRLALQLDPTLAEAHAAMGSALTDNRQFDEADAEFQQAFAINPSYGVAYHWYCHVVAARGRLDLALQQTDRSVALDPYSFIAHFIRVAYATDARRFAAALADADRAAALRTDVFLPLEAERIRSLVGLGRKDEALAVARRVLRDPELLDTGWWCAGDAVYALRQCGAEAEAVAAGQDLLQRIPRDSYIRGYVLCALGRFDEGVPALDNAPAILQGRMSWIPMFDAVRETPAYQQLLVRLNCVAEDKVARATLVRMLQEQAMHK